MRAAPVAAPVYNGAIAAARPRTAGAGYQSARGWRLDVFGRADLSVTIQTRGLPANTQASRLILDVMVAPDGAAYMVSALGQHISQVGMFKKMSLGKKVKEHAERAAALDASSIRARESLMQFYIQAPGIAGGSMDKAREQAAAIARINPAEGLRIDAILARVDKKPDAEVVAAWEKAIAGQPVSAFKAYRVSLVLSEGELVRHSKFGDGVVAKVIDLGKVEILFKDGPRMMAHGQTVP